MKEDTLITTAGRDPARNFGIVNPPVYHASTILAGSVSEQRERRERRFDKGVYSYGRQGTPTHGALEEAIAAIEGGDRAVCLSSGVAALNAGFLAFLAAGDHVLVCDTAYGPVRRFCDTFLGRFGVETTYYDPLIGGEIAGLIRDNTKLVYVESPGSLTFEVQDVPAIAEAAHGRGVPVMMDNTWSAGVYFKPFDHGVDVSVQAVTKYIGGHSDLMMGAITTTDAYWRQVRLSASDIGANSGPDDAYLALRGLRTLKARLAKHQDSALALADWLKGRPQVAAVLHPAFPDCPGHEIWRRDFTGACGLFSIVLTPCSDAAVEAMVDGMALFGLGASWGGFESLILPAGLNQIRTARPWTAENKVIRLHIGLEHPDDLKADLEAGLRRLTRADAEG